MERRRWARFNLILAAKVRIVGEETTEELRLETKNISAGGVALKTNHPLPVGTEVDLEVDLSYGDFLRFKGSVMTGAGRVVWNGEKEMAISLNRAAQIIMSSTEGPTYL